MTLAAEHVREAEKDFSPGGIDASHVAIVREELDRISSSQFFKNAVRGRQFLHYVVEQTLEGHSDQLKERTIGVEVFQRRPGYATGDDPVVRVQAGEVRRRLEQYHQTVADPPVRIELPIGSYAPHFHWPAVSEIGVVASSAPAQEQPAEKIVRKRWPWGVLAVVVAVVVALSFWKLPHAPQRSDFDQFWDPLIATQQPALICLAKGVTYEPGPGLYERYARTHPGAFQTEVERYSDPLPLDPKEKLVWGDMVLLDGYGVALGDVSAAVRFSTLLGKLGKANQLRIGANYSYADLRNSPAIVIGAFNNRWTMELLSAQHFSFAVDKGEYLIREQVPNGRTWRSQYGKGGVLAEDFAIVARLLDSKTGQFTVIAAGLRDSGTESAGELVSNPKYLEQVLRSAPAGWQKKNMEVVLKTNVIDSVPAPPEVVAAYFW